MKPRNAAIVGLLLLATCNEDFQAQDSNNDSVESSAKALTTAPASEVAVWQKVGDSSLPDGRYLQSAVFDSSRGVLVMFGGIVSSGSSYPGAKVQPNQETWEWNPKTGKWTNRTTTKGPEVRSGAAMVYDSDRKKVLLFGGRSGSGLDLEDTWEWDPATGVWTNVSAAGGQPSARSQAGMVYEKGANKVLLFGGGRSSANSYDGSGISVSLGDTWELDTTTYKWTQLKPATTPTVRHDFGMVWDATNSRAVLFGGMQTDIADAPGIPKQDTWVWTPADGTWTEKTAAGAKPSQRYAHAMAFDAGRSKIMVFGGLDVSTGGSLNDLWEMDATSLAWTERLTGAEAGIPTPRMYASLVYDDASARLDLLAGTASNNPGGMGGGIIMPGYPARGSRDIWEIEPVQLTMTDRSSPLDVPGQRVGQAMAYDPSTQKTYLFGGYDQWTGKTFEDMWAWNGKTWAQVPAETPPAGRTDGAMAYDPARKSLILFGGINNSTGTAYNDTWEFAGGKWTQLKTTSSPDGLYGHRMVTDMGRKKVLLFGGVNMNSMVPGPYMSPLRNDVWEWDGSTQAWTNRSPAAATSAPSPRYYALVGFDEGRQKLVLFESNYYGSAGSTFWEWDVITGGWEGRDTGDGTVGYGSYMFLAYDSIRRRHVILSGSNRGMSGPQETWELDTKKPTLYVRTTASSPTAAYGATMVFDSARGVVVFYGGQNPNTGMPLSDTWEYKVSSLGNGEGCTADFATSCASGFCVEGVCCEAAACSGACKSCNVAGSEGTCVMAKAGTEVPGSCDASQACDGTGSCKAKNGQVCPEASACASGFCVDGVCCDGACAGACASCNQAGREGKCTPYAAGSDPQNECGKGSGICKSTCDGVTGCAFPQSNVTCGTCMLCNGIGDCSVYDYSYNCMYNTGGNFGGSGGYYPRGGNGGYIPMGGSAGSGGYYPRGGSGGSGGSGPRSGGAGGGIIIPLSGGAGGSIFPSGGTTVAKGGTGGTIPQLGGTTGVLPSVGGTAGNLTTPDGSAGSTSVLPGAGGSALLRDAGGDGSTSTLSNKTGCSCAFGGDSLGRSGLTASFLLAAAAVVLRRRRRR